MVLWYHRCMDKAKAYTFEDLLEFEDDGRSYTCAGALRNHPAVELLGENLSQNLYAIITMRLSLLTGVPGADIPGTKAIERMIVEQYDTQDIFAITYQGTTINQQVESYFKAAVLNTVLTVLTEGDEDRIPVPVLGFTTSEATEELLPMPTDRAVLVDVISTYGPRIAMLSFTDTLKFLLSDEASETIQYLTDFDLWQEDTNPQGADFEQLIMMHPLLSTDLPSTVEAAQALSPGVLDVISWTAEFLVNAAKDVVGSTHTVALAKVRVLNLLLMHKGFTRDEAHIWLQAYLQIPAKDAISPKMFAEAL